MLLASAAGFTLPLQATAPPIITILPTFAAMLGSHCRARARLVKGASARIVTSPGCAFTVSTMNCAALSATGRPSGGGWFVFPKPSLPWTKSAIRFFAAPRYETWDPSATGTSRRPASSRSRMAFRVARAVGTFP